MLGGSSLDVPTRTPSSDTTADQASPQLASTLEARFGSTADCQAKYQGRLAAAVVDAVQLLSNLKVLELTFFPATTVSAVALEIPSIQVLPAQNLHCQADKNKQACKDS